MSIHYIEIAIYKHFFFLNIYTEINYINDYGLLL